MPAGSQLAAVEQHIMSSERARGVKGKKLKRMVYGHLNVMGLMHGNKPTKAGLAARHHVRPRTALD